MAAAAPDGQQREAPQAAELQWHFLQCFGQPSIAESAPAVDLLSALDFDASGRFLATGDRGGRVVLLQNSDAIQQARQGNPPESQWMLPMEFAYLTEFQAHQPAFDYLKSIEISEKINSLSWLKSTSRAHLLLSANDKQAKLWKVFERQAVQVSNYNIQKPHLRQSSLAYSTGPLSATSGSPPTAPPLPATKFNSPQDLRIPRVTATTKLFEARCKREFNPNRHTYFINSVSMNADDATFLTADDLAIRLWSLEDADASSLVLDLKPVVDQGQDALQVITKAAFSPLDCNLMAYSTSKIVLCMGDMRMKDLHGYHAKCFRHNLQQAVPNQFFSEIVFAASSFKFSPNGRHIITRDFMHASLWDIRREDAPVRTFNIHDHLWEHMPELYENDSIYDRLGCAVSPTGTHLAAGSYSELHVFNLESDRFTTLRSSGSPVAVNAQVGPQPRPPNSNYNWKVENITWHPTQPLVVATALNSLYTFCGRAASAS